MLKISIHCPGLRMALLALALSLVGLTPLPAATRLIEKVTSSGDEIVIPYAKYELDNGLTLIIHEDHSDPLVHVDVTYHVGSAREELGKSGFAHFFEHMMFQGSDNVADEEHFKIVTETGGTLNGTTNRDRTNYFETVPANQLEIMLWLEADRMGFFLDAVTQEKFEIQRATVKNEKQQNYDNRPYGMMQEINARALYPRGHPYSWLTIGVVEDLDRVDVNDLKRFFLRWYGPNNATLTVGGDVDTEEVIRLVEKYFGVIPRGPEVGKMAVPSVTVNEDRYVSYEDGNIRFPALLFTFPTVPRYHPDEAPLDCLAVILGQSKNSFLYKKFVKPRAAIAANVFNLNDELAGELTMFVIPFPGKSLADFEREMREILVAFETSGVRDEDIIKFKATREAELINGLNSVSGKVRQLAYHQIFRGEPNYISQQLAAYAAVTKEDVVRVYQKYLKGKSAVIQSILPKGSGMAPAKPGDVGVATDDYRAPKDVVDRELAYQKPQGDSFDRTQRPKAGKSPLVPVPDFWTTSFDNGLKVIGTIYAETPTITLQISLEGGHLLDGRTPEKAGLASLTAALLNESTQNYTPEEIAEELEKVGSSISVSAGSQTTSIMVQSLAKHIDRTLELLEEILMRPAFTQEDFDRLKKQQLEGIKATFKDPESIADWVFRKLLYGPENILGVSVEGNEKTAEAITLADIKAFYREYYTPAKAELVMVGSLGKAQILPKLHFLATWPAKAYSVPELPKPAKIAKTQIYLVDKPDAPQSVIRIGYVTDLTYDATADYFKAGLMNYPLGGAFNSRINLNLREDKGWTYGARSSFSSTHIPGPYRASAGVKGDATDGAVREFMKEITNYEKHGITHDELQFMKNSIGQRDARQFETPGQKAGFLGRIIRYGLERDYVTQQNQIIDAMTKDEIDQLASRLLPADRMHILVVGDKAAHRPKLEKLGYPIVELNVYGEPVAGKPREE